MKLECVCGANDIEAWASAAVLVGERVGRIDWVGADAGVKGDAGGNGLPLVAAGAGLRVGARERRKRVVGLVGLGVVSTSASAEHARERGGGPQGWGRQRRGW